MADIDEIISGARGNTRYSFDAIGDPVKAFRDAQKQADETNLRRAFKDGVPTGPDGQPDFAAMSKVLFQKGGLEQGVAAANLGLQQSKLKYGQNTDAAVNPSPDGGLPPSASRGASVPVLPPLNRGGEQAGSPPAAQPKQAGSQTIGQYLTAAGFPNDQIGAAGARIANQLGLEDPNTPIDMNDPQVRNVVVPAVQQFKRMGVGQVVQNGNMPPQPVQTAQAIPQQPQPPQQAQAVPPQPAQAAQSAPQAPQIPQQSGATDPRYVGLVPAGRSPDVQVHLLQRAINSGMLPPEQVKSYQNAIDAIRKISEPTPEIRNAAASGMTLPQYQEKQGELASQQAGSTERAKADVKEQQEYIDNGKMAQNRLGTLNTISNIVNTDKNLNLGFGSETTLKIKMALEKAGMDFGDLSGSQLIQKLNGILASESSKSFSTRPTQFEFKTFLANNPGLALDEKGNVRMLGILSQTAKREADLGKLARQNRDSWDKWDDVVEKYDREHPIKDPTTGKVLSNHSIIAPGPEQKPQNTQAAPKFATADDAMKAGMQKGQTFYVGDKQYKVK